MSGLAIHVQDPDVVIATRPGLLVASWAGTVRSSQIERLDHVIPELVRASEGGKYCSITIIEPTISMRFEEDARERSARLQKRWGGHMHAQAYLVEGVGFLPAAVRTVTSGLHLVTRAPYPLEVFRDAREAADWIARRGELGAATVEDAIARVRDAVRDAS